VLQGVTAVDDRSRLLVLAALAAFAAAVWLSSGRRPVKLSDTRSVLLVLAILMLAALLLVEVLEALDVAARDRYGSAFTLGLVAAFLLLGYRLWQKPPLTPASLYLLVALIFMAVNAFGTGYAAHYAPWFVPALIATYVLLDDVWRRLLLVGYFVAAVTYAVEYALISFLGAYLDPIFGYPQWVDDAGQWLFPSHRWGLVRLPLVVIYVVVIAAGIARLPGLMMRSSGDSGARTSRPEGLPGETAPARS
jgi:hypothetical protein